MSEPIYDSSTEALYASLPDIYRSEDAEQNWVLKKWLYGLTTQVDSVNQKVERFSYVPPEDGPGYRTSDLVDPLTADSSWLPWLAQLVSVRLDTSAPVPDQRQTIANSILGIKAGSKAAIAQAASTALIGTKDVKVFDHSDAVSIGTAGQWDICVVTKDTETLDNSLPVTQAKFTSTNGWTSNSWFLNLIGNVAWTTTGMTASTGSTNPLLANYDTFSGAGNTYSAQVAIPGTAYKGSVMLRCTDGLATSADLELVFMNGGSQVGTTLVTAGGIDTNWRKFSVSGTAPANTTHVRLKLTRSAAGVLQVSNKMISQVDTPAYFDSTFAGASTEDSQAVTYPIINYWRNASYDVAGGMTLNNGTLGTSTARFQYGNTSGLFEVTGSSDPYLSPTQTVPTYEGETVIASVWVMGAQDGGTARLEIRTTKADGTTDSTYSAWENIVDELFTQITKVQISVQNAKSCQVYLHFTATVTDKFYVDGGLTTRMSHGLGYFDGNRTGNTWTDVNHANAITTHDSTTTANIVTETFLTDSNSVRVTALSDSMAIKVQMNPSLSPITVTASDPWTFMASAYCLQNGSYYAVFQAIYYNNADVETGRTSKAYALTAAATPVAMVVQATMPATTTRARLRIYIYGCKQGDTFGVTRAGARLGNTTEWIGVTADPVAAVIAAGAKPAGVILHAQTFSADWAAIEAALPTWADWEGKTWAEIEEIGL